MQFSLLVNYITDFNCNILKDLFKYKWMQIYDWMQPDDHN